MEAAAFCTPGEGGGSDIFVHSAIALETPAGQHTVQHEIAHAVQNERGQTQSLDGLGGNTAVRDSLEADADRHAAAIAGKNAVQREKREG
jgi:hypothetical protein